MSSHLRRTLVGTATAVALTAALVGPAAAAHQTPLIGLTVGGWLVQFTPETACRPTDAVKVSGLARGETLLAIDERPATGELYGLGSSSRLYVIDPDSGVATAVSATPFSPALRGDAFGFDFNPTVDRIRIVSDSGQDLRAHPDTGLIVAVDMPLRYAPADVRAGADADVVAAAYTNPDNDPATGTTLYDIDASPDALVIQAPPNDGILNTVGGTFRANGLTGFDIAPGNTAFAAFKATGGPRYCGPTTIASIDLATGAVAMTWSLGTRTPLRGLAVDLP
jgi:hypothetical protein